jgi:hypothetical protein
LVGGPALCHQAIQPELVLTERGLIGQQAKFGLRGALGSLRRRTVAAWRRDQCLRVDLPTTRPADDIEEFENDNNYDELYRATADTGGPSWEIGGPQPAR